MTKRKPYVPRHADVAVWCGVSVDTVHSWATGRTAAPARAIGQMKRHDPRVNVEEITMCWTELYEQRHHA